MVDDADFEYLRQWKWCAGRDHYTYYAVRGNKKAGRLINMHRVLLDAPEGVKVDHLDHNGLNNQRSNIKLATNSENSLNIREITARNTSGVVGVHWLKRDKRWMAKTRVNGVRLCVGIFEHLEDAAMALVNYEPPTT
jgi:hypothetical protein